MPLVAGTKGRTVACVDSGLATYRGPAKRNANIPLILYVLWGSVAVRVMMLCFSGPVDWTHIGDDLCVVRGWMLDGTWGRERPAS